MHNSKIFLGILKNDAHLEERFQTLLQGLRLVALFVAVLGSGATVGYRPVALATLLALRDCA